MRNFLLRGPAGTGKTEGAKAIASALHLPYRCITCSANTEVFDLLGQILPDVDGKRTRLQRQYPSFQEIQLDPSGAYQKLTGNYDEEISAEDTYQKLIDTIFDEMHSYYKEHTSGQNFQYVDTILDENNPGVTYVSQYQGSGYEHAAEDLFRILNDVAAEKVQEDCQTELTEELQKTANDIHYGNAHAGIHVTIHRLTSVSDYLKNEYQTVAPPLLRASKKLQSTILPLLKEEQQGGKQKNLLFGKRLDSHALYKTDGTIFTRTRLPGEEKRLAVALLIDESGSMGWGDRMTHARKTAIVLYDFCKSLGIPITIYGHSTDAGGVALYSYAEFDSVDNEDCYRLMDMCDRNGNRDGAALRFVAEHLCTRPELQKLLILISDGQPADYGYSGTEAEADLRGIKKEYEKRDVILFAAAIGDDKENIRRIYKDGFLDITKLEELPKNMAQLVKQHLK